MRKGLIVLAFVMVASAPRTSRACGDSEAINLAECLALSIPHAGFQAIGAGPCIQEWAMDMAQCLAVGMLPEEAQMLGCMVASLKDFASCVGEAVYAASNLELMQCIGEWDRDNLDCLVGLLDQTESIAFGAEQAGAPRLSYSANEPMAIGGRGLPAGASVGLRVFRLADGLPGVGAFPPDPSGLVETATVNGDGVLAPVTVWEPPLEPGQYQVVIDVDANGSFDPNTDRVGEPPGIRVYGPEELTGLTVYTFPETVEPGDIVSAPDGTIWFGEYARNHVAALEPATGHVKEWVLPSGAQPQGMALGPGGTVYCVERGLGRLARLDPAAARLKEWQVGSGTSSGFVAVGTDRIFFSQGASGLVGWLKEPDEVATYQVEGTPRGVAVGREGKAYFALRSDSGMSPPNRIAVLDPTTGGLTLVTLPSSVVGVDAIALASDGTVWVTHYAGLARIDLSTTPPTVRRYSYGWGEYFAVLPLFDGFVYATDEQGNRILAVDPRTEAGTDGAATVAPGPGPTITTIAPTEQDVSTVERTLAPTPVTGIVTSAGSLTQYSMPSSAAGPRRLSVDAFGRLWVSLAGGSSVALAHGDRVPLGPGLQAGYLAPISWIVSGRESTLLALAPLARPPLTFSLVEGSLPQGLQLDPSTGVIKGKTSGYGGLSRFRLRVTDATQTSDEATYELKVLAPRLEAEPDPLDLGTHVFGEDARGALTIRNLGTYPLTYTASIEPAGSVSILSGGGGVVPVQGLSELVVGVSAVGEHAAEIVLASDDPMKPEVRVPVTARIVAQTTDGGVDGPPGDASTGSDDDGGGGCACNAPRGESGHEVWVLVLVLCAGCLRVRSRRTRKTGSLGV